VNLVQADLSMIPSPEAMAELFAKK
jgi:hypothetical protein